MTGRGFPGRTVAQRVTASAAPAIDRAVRAHTEDLARQLDDTGGRTTILRRGPGAYRIVMPAARSTDDEDIR
ncbi:hypothetical protein [Bauldia sp.]|uniref:hypothetical protein n=1 Tax=Bauldia sp. TaxID=2575872 RepID=UPI003BAD96D2